jgi:hypothetical protein
MYYVFVLLLSVVVKNRCIKELQPPPSKRLRVRLAAGSVCCAFIKLSHVFARTVLLVIYTFFDFVIYFVAT